MRQSDLEDVINGVPINGVIEVGCGRGDNAVIWHALGIKSIMLIEPKNDLLEEAIRRIFSDIYGPHETPNCFSQTFVKASSQDGVTAGGVLYRRIDAMLADYAKWGVDPKVFELLVINEGVNVLPVIEGCGDAIAQFRHIIIDTPSEADAASVVGFIQTGKVGEWVAYGRAN